jgi:serine/threonine-protein kinase
MKCPPRTCVACGAEVDAGLFCPACGAAVPDTTGDTEPEVDTDELVRSRLGETIGSYRLIGVLGKGGMGTVYRAEHLRLGRQVALKMLHPQSQKKAIAVRRFFDEAAVVNRIAHENIVQITDFVEGGDGPDGPQPSYYIMELLRGVDLRQLMVVEGALDLRRVLHIGAQVASALTAVHAAGVIHRDLKPANIFICQRGNDPDVVKLLDFGVAKFCRGDSQDPVGGPRLPEAALSRTAAGIVLGTPGFMSPEQACGSPIDHRTDIYAFGVILYLLATGRPPFHAKSFGEMVVKHKELIPLRPSTIRQHTEALPPALDQLIIECLGKSPDARPASMAEVEERLRTILAQLPPALAQPTGRPSRKTPGTPRPRVAFAAAVAAIAVIAALGIVALVATRSTMPGLRTDTGETLAFGKRRGWALANGNDPAITVVFSSQPEGATVSFAGDPKVLGTTPWVHTFKPHDLPAPVPGQSNRVVFELRKPGFAPARRAVRTQVKVSHVFAELPPTKSPGESAALGPSAGPDNPPTDLRDPWIETNP